MEGREDPSVGAEVRVIHVRPFDRAAHPERDAAELIRGHGGGPSFIVCSPGSDIGSPEGLPYDRALS